ncbi:FHA domain-containing protein DDL isoform X3 [Beta vulgaris subsp. vulgaris]|uniref:FHA domain-containing protein DDL isoform X3 n=1 Tax=Beta vulgaris subsp. vulgaris TaxID=3555 RepID=UPI0020373707|nr:FHA domain-containing protein DDL isoform X3 [Beta vulgaris subsp. vulgaris]
MSPSVARRSPKGHHSSRRSVSPERNHGEPRRRGRSPAAISRSSRSPSCRERSPVSHKSSHRDRGGSAVRERHSGRVKSPKRKKSSSPVPRSPSPRTKRLRRAQADYDEEALEREHESKHRKGSDKSKHERVHKERDFEKEVSKGRRERKSEKERDRGQPRDGDGAGGASSRPRHRRSESPLDHHRHRGRHHSRSPPPASRSRARDEDEASRGAAHLDDGSDSLAMMEATEQALETKQKQKPSFALSGKLAEETNRVREPLYVHRQSCYLFGRERRVADIPTDHPSCSKQHAVLQYRQVEKEKPDGMMSKEVRPYLMDLGSTNKTFVNDNAIEPQRYYELFEKDTIRFGNSSREYVLLHENSNT